MNAFIPSVETLGLLEPATAFPTQIYAWADSPERGFVARTSAAILVLLVFLMAMNAAAIVLRQRFERKW
jgi:phosphate transport system permease protein